MMRPKLYYIGSYFLLMQQGGWPLYIIKIKSRIYIYLKYILFKYKLGVKERYRAAVRGEDLASELKTTKPVMYCFLPTLGNRQRLATNQSQIWRTHLWVALLTICMDVITTFSFDISNVWPFRDFQYQSQRQSFFRGMFISKVIYMSVVTILMSLITDIKSNTDWQVKNCPMDVVSLWQQLLNVLLSRDM